MCCSDVKGILSTSKYCSRKWSWTWLSYGNTNSVQFFQCWCQWESAKWPHARIWKLGSFNVEGYFKHILDDKQIFYHVCWKVNQISLDGRKVDFIDIRHRTYVPGGPSKCGNPIKIEYGLMADVFKNIVEQSFSILDLCMMVQSSFYFLQSFQLQSISSDCHHQSRSGVKKHAPFKADFTSEVNC